MSKTPPSAKDFPSDKGADDLVDRGDGYKPPEEEEIEEEEVEEVPGEKATKKTAKKAAKKTAAADPEDEEEEDEEEEDEEEEDEEQADTAKTVPLRVLKKSQEKRRKAETRVRELEDQLNKQKTDASDRQREKFDKLSSRMEELYEQVEEARAEGRTKDAAKLQRELDGIRGDMTRAEATFHATKQALAQQNHIAFNALVAELEAIDARFDEDHDDFDEDLVERVSELTDAYEAKGLNAPEALRKALRLILGSDPFREGRRLAAKPVEKEKAKPRGTDVTKNLEARKKQPPEDKQGSLEKKSDVNPLKLSDEDYEKLPETTRRRLRGDFPEEART